MVAQDYKNRNIEQIYRKEILRVIEQALQEDFVYGPDLTTIYTIKAGTRATAHFVARQSGVLCGMESIDSTYGILPQFYPEAADSALHLIQCTPHKKDGEWVESGERIMTVEGDVRSILMGERTALNIICLLSGIASTTRQWVDAIAGTKAHVRDTRKTLPGLRAAQKYAVKCGGGVNHRLALGDEILIKDNHIAAAGDIAQAFALVSQQNHDRIPIEVEVDTLEQLDTMLEMKAPTILLDNFPLWQTQIAVARRDSFAREQGHRSCLESSGGLTLASAHDYARTGVDLLAVGGLTHTLQPLDIGLDWQ